MKTLILLCSFILLCSCSNVPKKYKYVEYKLVCNNYEMMVWLKAPTKGSYYQEYKEIGTDNEVNFSYDNCVRIKILEKPWEDK